ncbi:MAG: shikimate dehydrogenase [Acidobacteriota bacterium]|nr:shikimate dehydrogenase [Acidobacteriota bacterium]MDH3528835.1 shikimate dehydrogenase [Acidobacteriota bacterium]
MNDGLICVSVHADTLDKLISRVAAVPAEADLIEIRFDSLDPSEIGDPLNSGGAVRKVFDTFPDRKFLVTLRPESEGGFRPIQKSERLAFWNSGIDADYVDIEFELVEENPELLTNHRIVSIHDFDNDSKRVEAFCAAAREKPDDLVKIAVTADDVVDGLDLWKRFQDFRFAAGDGVAGNRLIPISMGAKGIWTRILGAAFGSPITYAAADGLAPTAAGQISYTDLTEVYRVKSLSPDTEIYGVTGSALGHSLSSPMHNAAFAAAALDAVYIPFELSDLGAFINRMVRPQTREIDWNLRGFSVTIPFKQEILAYLDFTDPAAASIGAVNTVQLVDQKLVGFNTDAAGFLKPLSDKYGDLKDASVAVIGAGGAARACVYGLRAAGAGVTIFARKIEQAESVAEDLGCDAMELPRLPNVIRCFQIAVNATPLGSHGALEDKSALEDVDLKNLQLAYDLVYNPRDTLFLRDAKKAGVPTIGGLAMLVGQGAKQFELWTGRAAPLEVMQKAALSGLVSR